MSWVWSSEAAYQRLYTESLHYHEAESLLEGVAPFWQRDTEALVAAHARLDWVESVVGPVRGRCLLDVGAGTGSFVAAAQMRGSLYALSIEPNQAMVDRARSMGRPVYCLGWEDLPPTGVYDLVTAHDVFEHVTRPLQFLERMRGSLSPDGFLVIEMPEIDGPAHRREGESLRHLKPRQHPLLYSRPAFEALVEREGWEVVAFHRPAAGALGKMSHILQKVRTDDAPSRPPLRSPVPPEPAPAEALLRPQDAIGLRTAHV